MAPDGLRRRQKKTKPHQGLETATPDHEVLEAATPDHAGSSDSHFETVPSQAIDPFLPDLHPEQMSAKPVEGGVWRSQYIDNEGNFYQTPWYAQRP